MEFKSTTVAAEIFSGDSVIMSSNQTLMWLVTKNNANKHCCKK